MGVFILFFHKNPIAETKKIAGKNKCEVIALTNHVNQMIRANENAKELMQYSSEIKNNSGVMRYPLRYKTQWLYKFKNIYKEFFEIDTIRYIF